MKDACRGEEVDEELEKEMNEVKTKDELDNKRERRREK